MKLVKRIICTILCGGCTFLWTAVPTMAAQYYVQPIVECVIQDKKSSDKFEKLIVLLLESKKMNSELDVKTFTKVIENKLVTERSLQARGIGDIWNSLTSEEKKLVIRYPFDALKVNNAKDIATTQTMNKFGYNGLGDRSDAFRHAMWNAKMTILIGEDKAELFATAHEEKDISGIEPDGFSKVEHKEMDLHNNSIGRKIASSNTGVSEDELSDIIYNNIFQAETEFIWLHD